MSGPSKHMRVLVIFSKYQDSATHCETKYLNTVSMTLHESPINLIGNEPHRGDNSLCVPLQTVALGIKYAASYTLGEGFTFGLRYCCSRCCQYLQPVRRCVYWKARRWPQDSAVCVRRGPESPQALKFAVKAQRPSTQIA